MGEPTAEQVAHRVLDLNLIDERQLNDVWAVLGTQDVTADELLQTLVRRELLTNFQVERLLKGERSGYFYGDYKVLYRVASGSFARVYRAVSTKTGKVVALKVLRQRHTKEADRTDQFCREGELGRTLRHENIVPIYEVHSQGGSHYLVMEFVEGRNLRDFVKIRGKLSPAEATQLMIDIAGGLHYAFERGVCHRDLKMTNVLVSSRGQGRLVDFGLAAADDRISDDALANQPNQRTVDYTGLERATGVRKDDNRSDIYFLGCIFYNLLTGEPPMPETKDRVQRMSKSRFLDVVPIHKAMPELPKVVALVVNKAMELDPERRYQSPGQMLVDLKIVAERLASGNDIAELPESTGDASQLGSDAERERWGQMVAGRQQQRSVMFVESNSKMQDIVRDGLKSKGYRVLVISDAERAIARFTDDEKPADCVIFSAGSLGTTALEAFNRFVTDEKTARIPVVLLLTKKQVDWRSSDGLAEHQVVANLPLQMRQLRGLLNRLVPTGQTSAES